MVQGGRLTKIQRTSRPDYILHMSWRLDKDWKSRWKKRKKKEWAIKDACLRRSRLGEGHCYLALSTFNVLSPKKKGNRETGNSNAPENWEEFSSVDPSDEKYKDIIKNASAKVGWQQSEAAMPCKRAFSQACLRVTVFFFSRKQEKKRHLKQRPDSVVLLEAHESTRQRMESVTKRRIHEEHIAGKGHNFLYSISI